jgi:DNA-binding transcriptional MerR regulator
VSYCSLAAAAHLTGLSPTRARLLVRSGLVQPAMVEKGHLLFGPAELARFRKIRRLSKCWRLDNETQAPDGQNR